MGLLAASSPWQPRIETSYTGHATRSGAARARNEKLCTSHAPTASREPTARVPALVSCRWRRSKRSISASCLTTSTSPRSSSTRAGTTSEARPARLLQGRHSARRWARGIAVCIADERQAGRGKATTWYMLDLEPQWRSTPVSALSPYTVYSDRASGNTSSGNDWWPSSQTPKVQSAVVSCTTSGCIVVQKKALFHESPWEAPPLRTVTRRAPLRALHLPMFMARGIA